MKLKNRMVEKNFMVLYLMSIKGISRFWRMIVALRLLLQPLVPEQVKSKVIQLKYIRWNPLLTWNLTKAVAIHLSRMFYGKYYCKCLNSDLRNTSSEKAWIGFESPEPQNNCLTQRYVLDLLGIILCQCVKIK